MDDRERLIRLLMMVKEQIREWVQPAAARRMAELFEHGRQGEVDPLEDKTPVEAAGNLLATMTRYITLADQWYRSGGTQGDLQDAYQLPGFVLEAVSVLPEDVVLLIGEWVKEALGVADADARDVGQLWVQDAKTTAWRLLIEHGQWPGHHTDKREPVDTQE